MKIAITGATGFIGKRLCQKLLADNDKVIAFTRDIEKARSVLGGRVKPAIWDVRNPHEISKSADGADAIVNLAGENIGEGRWTEEKKNRLLKSRIETGRAIVEAIKGMNKRPEVLIQASAIGYYGKCGDEILDESSAPGEGFLAEVTEKWEQSTREVLSFGVRRVIIRTSPVLGPFGGLLPQMIKPFRFFVGGVVGKGNEWFSWIHLDDEVGAIRFLIESKNQKDVFNLAAPNPIMTKDFFKTLGKVLKRPCWLKVPAPLMYILMGEKADELLFSSKRVMPKRLLEAGFKFNFSDIHSALRNIFT
jgi:hypothetical protein